MAAAQNGDDAGDEVSRNEKRSPNNRIAPASSHHAPFAPTAKSARTPRTDPRPPRTDLKPPRTDRAARSNPLYALCSLDSVLALFFRRPESAFPAIKRRRPWLAIRLPRLR